MKYIAIIKRRFKKSETVEVLGEDMYWALQNVQREYPKHKIISIDYF